MTLEQLQNNEHLLLKCISGSHAYGLALPHSDTDIKGVFVLPKTEFYGLAYTDQINNATNDEMYYEVKKFIDLLLRNNPNILELLSTPEDCILYKHPVMDLIKPEMFLSKLCNQTFGQYAYAQIKKARGLNKKILNPIDEKRKNILNFCYVVHGYKSIPASVWLDQQNYAQQECGLVRIDHMREIYAVFHQSQTDKKLSGFYSDDHADDVSLSSVPEGLSPKAILHFNKDGYSVYCKEYKQYWEWVKERNDERYENTISHGKNYDAKNMMHVFRLLNMAEEIALQNRVNVRRPEREWLLRVRAGQYMYNDLLQQAETKIQTIAELFKKSNLPEQPDHHYAEELLIRIRNEFYSK
ncbi:MAG: nucleotidyltransferase domain-containing protein [Cyclobacteriaceae bacterium]|nr:MAG: nucleotidyltransferase domain-containing protein [Cyclobacteriaceae bacterium]